MSSFARCFAAATLALFTISLAAQNATFEKRTASVNPGTFTFDWATQVDLNEDGTPDFVSYASTSAGSTVPHYLSVLLSNGAASYNPQPTDYAIPGSGWLGIYTHRPKAGDFNHDGHLDVAVLNEGVLYLYFGNGDGTLRAPTTLSSSSGSISDFEVADFNNDGVSDIAVNVNRTAWVYLSQGDGTFAAPMQGPAGNNDLTFYAGDFDGDGNQDLFVFDESCGESACGEQFEWFWGDGTGHFPATSSLSDATYHLYNAVVVAVADLNGDGRTDVMGSATDNNGAGYHFVFYGNAARSPLKQPVSHVGIPGDFDGDGDLDLALTNYQISYRNADGSYSAPVTYGSGNASANRFPFVGDFNHDGKADILWPVVTSSTNPNNATGMEIFLNSSAGAGCATPASVGMTVCDPQDGSSVPSPVRLRASAKLSTSVYRFEVWANGTKIYTGRDTGSIDTQVPMDVGSYTMTFVARSSSGERVEQTIDVTVEGSPDNCQPPTENGIVICEPAANATVSSPFHVKALAKTGNTWRFELWDGNSGTKLLTVRDSGYMSGWVSLSAGTHRLVFVARREDGYRVSAERYVTVQ